MPFGRNRTQATDPMWIGFELSFPRNNLGSGATFTLKQSKDRCSITAAASWLNLKCRGFFLCQLTLNSYT